MLARRKPPRMGTREQTRIRSDSHLRWVRGFVCAAFGRPGHTCEGRMEAHHVRTGTDGAAGLKPSDEWAIAVCALAHREIHDRGETTMAARWGLDFLAVAAKLWRTSPHRRKAEGER